MVKNYEALLQHPCRMRMCIEKKKGGVDVDVMVVRVRKEACFDEEFMEGSVLR